MAIVENVDFFRRNFMFLASKRKRGGEMSTEEISKNFTKNRRKIREISVYISVYFADFLKKSTSSTSIDLTTPNFPTLI